MTTIDASVAQYGPLAGRAKLVLAVLVMVIGLDLVAVVSDVLEWRLLDRVGEDGLLTVADAEANDDRQETIGLLQFGAFVVAAVAFIRWFRRAYGNLPALGVPRLRFGPGWAIGAWFIPILNLFRPKQIANDIWRGSDPGAAAVLDDGWTKRPYDALLTIWWALFILSNLGGVFLVGALPGESAGELKRVALAWVAIDLIDAAAALSAFLVVRAITARQEARARLFVT